MTTAIIGFEPSISERIRNEVRSSDNRVYIYDTLPEGYSDNGMFHVKHSSMDQWITPKVCLYYSYFPNSISFRKALAISNTPSFPSVEKTILHDDKDLSLIYQKFFGFSTLPRGYIPNNIEVSLPERVVKYGNLHCGLNKNIHPGGVLSKNSLASYDYLVEPFIEGESYRVLVIGDKTWTIHYQSDDWRKNINSTKSLLSNQKWESTYLERTKALGLVVAGWDFITDGTSIFDLEVNCYPEIPDFAQEAFVKESIAFIRMACPKQ